MEILIGLTIPFLGTTIGAALVFLLRNKISGKTNKAMCGFAAGVMVAATFWSLLQPAFEQAGRELGMLGPYLPGSSPVYVSCFSSTPLSRTST